MEYYNEWLNYYCKHPEKIRYSRAWLSKNFDCTPEGRKICQGKCCKSVKYSEKTKKGIYVKYREEEWELIPDDIKKKIEPFLLDERIVKVTEDGCSLGNFCMKHPEYEPRECKISPLTFSKDGLLKVGYGNMFRCPNYKKGKPVWISMKDNLISLFGDKFYNRLKSDMETTVDKWIV